MDRKIIVNYIFNTINEILTILTSIVVVPYLSRTLGAEGIGVFSFTQSIVTYFVLLSVLGTATYGRRAISVSRDDPAELFKNFKEIMLLRTMTGATAMVIYLLYAFHMSTHRVEYLLFSIYIIGELLDINWFFIGIEEFKITAVRNTIIKLSGLVLVFIFVKTPADVPVYIFLFSVSSLLGNLSLWLLLPRYLPAAKGVSCAPLRILAPVLLLFLPTVAAKIYTVMDKSMLGWIVQSDYQSGCYEQAEKIVRFAITIITSISTVIASRVAYNYKTGNRAAMHENIYATSRFIWMLSVPVFLGIMSIADIFIPFFLGSGFEVAVVLMRIFSFLIFPVSFSHLIGLSFLIQINRENIYTRAVVLAAVVNVCMNAVLIRYMQSSGAAAASVVSECLGISYMLQYCRKNRLLSMRTMIGCSWKYWMAGVIMTICILAFRMAGGRLFSSLVELGIVFLLAVPAYFISLVVMKDELILRWLRAVR